jgi:FkbM family methyltransferase
MSRMFKKIITVIIFVKNWYLVPIDKIVGRRNIIYKFRNNILVECRTKSTDINEAVVVLSGQEYPLKFNVLDNRSKKVVFDLGGNIGTYSLLFNSLNKDLDYAGYIFEPHPGNIKILKNNLLLNNVTKFTVIKKAIAGENGLLKFDVSGGFDSFKIDNKSKNYIEVDAVKMSDFCKFNNIKQIDLLKMDIEGGEYDILANDFEFLSNHVKIIMLEYHNLDQDRNYEYILKKLEESFIVNVEHGHLGGGIISAINKNTM